MEAGAMNAMARRQGFLTRRIPGRDVQPASGVAAPAMAQPPAAQPRKVVVKRGILAALLWPIGVSLGVVLAAYGLVTIGTNWHRSYQRHIEHTLPVHADRSIFDVLFRSDIPEDAVDLVIRDADGTVRHVVAERSVTDRFVNETIAALDAERDRIKQAASEDVARAFDLAFADREQAIGAYADWFFEWKRSYIVLKDTISASMTRLVELGRYESLSEAVERDVKDYFMRHYQEQVLKPELRDRPVSSGLESAAREAHESYRRVIANHDMRLQLFLAQHTTHLKTVAADDKLTNAELDWDSQKWKAPTYLMEDAAFGAVSGLGVAAAGGTVGALTLGPAINAAMARSFGALSARFASSMSARLAMAQGGAVAGGAVNPAGGMVVGAAAGIVLGVIADYFINRADETFNRADFVAANNEALDATIATWREKVTGSVHTAIDKWFDDARSSVILSAQEPGTS
jgi:Arc/MetJ-type ribon-helix-helix transcriptional regulator